MAPKGKAMPKSLLLRALNAPPLLGSPAEPKACPTGNALGQASAKVENAKASAPIALRPAGGKKRGRVPDLDSALSETALHVNQAKKILRAAANDRRNAMRRRARIVHKSAKLPADDLYKIAVYKRTNFLAHILENDSEGLQKSLEQLVANATPNDVSKLLEHLANVAGAPASFKDKLGEKSEASASASGEVLAIAAEPAAAASGEGLPSVPPLQQPAQLPDGSEAYAEKAILAATGTEPLAELDSLQQEEEDL